MSATTYGRTGTPRRHPGQIATAVGDAVMDWLARVGERSAAGRAARNYQRLNALSDAQLARMDMRRSNLIERCYGWRAYY